MAIQNAIDADAAVAQALASVTAMRSDRDTKIAIVATQTKLIVNGVVGDPAYGSNSDLYDAMGFVTDSKRATGLTQRTVMSPAERLAIAAAERAARAAYLLAHPHV